MLRELREGKSRAILTVDKEVAIGVLNKHDYINKDKDLLVD